MKCDICGSRKDVMEWDSVLMPGVKMRECPYCYELVEKWTKGKLTEEQCKKLTAIRRLKVKRGAAE